MDISEDRVVPRCSFKTLVPSRDINKMLFCAFVQNSIFYILIASALLIDRILLD